MSIEEVWDTIKVHNLMNMVHDVWDDNGIIMIQVNGARTATYLENLFSGSAVEVMVTK